MKNYLILFFKWFINLFKNKSTKERERVSTIVQNAMTKSKKRMETTNTKLKKIVGSLSRRNNYGQNPIPTRFDVTRSMRIKNRTKYK